MTETALDPILILIVEDEAMIRMNGVDMLEDAGFKVIDAASADEAIAQLEGAKDVQLLFSDVDMPGSMNGLALAELVHARWPQIHLVMTSGHRRLTPDDMPDDGLFVPKPYSRDGLIAQINAMLRRDS